MEIDDFEFELRFELNYWTDRILICLGSSGGFRGVARGAVAPPSCHLRKCKRMNILT